MLENYYHFNFRNNVKWKFIGGMPRVIDKTITGVFPLSWQDGIGGDLVNYSITGASGGVGDYGGKRNQMVQNGNFESADGWGYSSGTISVLNNVCYFTIEDDTSNRQRIQKDMSFVNGHSVLVLVSIKPKKNTVVSAYYGGNYATSVGASANEKTECAYLRTITDGSDTYFGLYCNSTLDLSNGDIVEYSNVQTFDLTAMFPNETITDVATAKARIAEVMGGQQEYYPYDAGTDYYKVPVVVTDQNRFAFNSLSLTNLSQNGNRFTSTVTDSAGQFNCELRSFNGDSRVEILSYQTITKSGHYVFPITITNADFDSFVFGHDGAERNISLKTLCNAFIGTYYLTFDVFACDETVVGGLVFGNIRIVTYEQLKTIYRTAQLTAGQTIRKTQDGLPNFTDLPTGYLQMGVDTQVAPSGGSVTYKSRSVSI